MFKIDKNVKSSFPLLIWYFKNYYQNKWLTEIYRFSSIFFSSTVVCCLICIYRVNFYVTKWNIMYRVFKTVCRRSCSLSSDWSEYWLDVIHYSVPPLLLPPLSQSIYSKHTNIQITSADPTYLHAPSLCLSDEKLRVTKQLFDIKITDRPTVPS